MTVLTKAREALYLGFKIDCMDNTCHQDSKRNECHGGRYFAESLQDHQISTTIDEWHSTEPKE
jgi:hypothetical protein